MIQTPFRFPGSKNKLLPIIMFHIDKMMINQDMFCDAFIGGGSVLLEVAQKYPNVKLYANDKDYWIFSFWKIIAGNDFNKLSKLLKLLDNQPTLELFYKLREEQTIDEIQCAYKAIFFNRTTFSGIAKAGPIGGKEQKSAYTIDCRYNSNKLKKKILVCHSLLKNRVIIENYDIKDYNLINDTNCPAYLDPPYLKKGQSLYSEYMSIEEHQALSQSLLFRKNWVLSYDDCSEIRKFYQNKSILDLNTRYCINGAKINWQHKNELIILS